LYVRNRTEKALEKAAVAYPPRKEEMGGVMEDQ
jgi:hypothetical protein